MKGIVLLTMARSRSSMTAEIFRRHGVFFGETRRMGQKGGIGYNENLELKKIARKKRPNSYNDIIKGKDPTLVIEHFASIWYAILVGQGYRDGQVWGAKVDAFCDRLFDGLKHVKIGIWRNVPDIVASCERTRGMGPRAAEDWARIVRAHHERLRKLHIPIIDTDQVVEGNHQSLETAFKACGLTYDRSVGESVIDRSH